MVNEFLMHTLYRALTAKWLTQHSHKTPEFLQKDIQELPYFISDEN